MTDKLSKRGRICAAAFFCCTLGAAAAQPASAAMYSEDALATAGVITKPSAIAIALRAVGGGTAISAAFENEDHLSHWTVDIIGAKYEYEVWVSVSGTIQRIITQPK